MALRALLAGAALLLVLTFSVWDSARAAISYVGFSWAFTFTDSSGAITVSRPSGVAADDLLVVAIAQDSNDPITTPTGWTLRQLSSANSPRLGVYTKRATGSEPASYTFNGGGADNLVAAISVYRGMDVSTPVDTSAVQYNGFTSTATAPSVTTTVDSAMMVSFWASTDDCPVSLPSGMTLVYSVSEADAIPDTCLMSAHETRSAAGATGTRAVTLTGSDNNQGLTLALRPITYSISGTVFEDVNYGGGAGRNRSTAVAAGGSARSGARVELYTVSGSTATYRSATTTDASGTYSFTTLAEGNYAVRVVNSTVVSGRPGGSSASIGVPVFMTDASSGAATAVTDRVGGFNPAASAEAGWAGVGSAFNTATGVFSAGISGQAQAIAPVTLTSTSVTGVDFGFNFSTVVNTNASGPGSLYQFVQNANALGGESSLAQSGSRRSGTDALEALPAGRETSIFMIPAGTAVPGLRATTASQLTSGVAVINIASLNLPALNSTLTSIDGTTQSANIGNANAGLLGTGGTVGVDALALSRVPMPEVELNGGGSGIGVSLQGSQLVARGMAVRGVSYGLYLGSTASGNIVEWNVIGSGATSFTDPGASLRVGYGVYAVAQTSLTVLNNLIGYSNEWGIHLGTVTSSAVSGNEVQFTGITNAFADAIGVFPGSGNMISGNLSAGSGGYGIDVWIDSDYNTVVNNTTTGNGVWATDPGGIRIWGDGNTIDRNVVSGNYRSGIVIEAGVSNRITRNATTGNGGVPATRSGGAATTGLGIDLDLNHTVLANDGARNRWQDNYGMDHPVLTSATWTGGSGALSVTGYVGSGAAQGAFAYVTVEFFKSSADSSGYGEGATYLGSLTTGANGNFSGSFATAATLSSGDRITATATDSLGNTSEFGPNFTATSTTAISGTVYEDVNYGGGAGRSLAAGGGVGLAGATVELYSAATGLVASTTTSSTGTYSFSGMASGGYYVRVVLDTVRSSRSGSTAGLLPVQTWRYEASRQTPAAVTDEVGGARPEVADSAAAVTPVWVQCATEYYGSANSCSFTGTRLVRFGADTRWTVRVATGGVTCGNSTFGDPAVGTPKSCQVLTPHLHSASSVEVGTGGVSGVDFGFNFSTVVNTNDSGAGSLRQAITNANTLTGDGGLAQAGRTSGLEHLVFMISNGSSAAGLRSGVSLFSGGAATITLSSGLPSIAGPLILDAQTQPGWVSTPVVVLDGNLVSADGLAVGAAAGSSRITGFVIRRFTGRGVSVASGANSVTITGNYIGRLTAAGLNAGAGFGNTADGIRTNGIGTVIGGSTAAQRNVIAGNGDLGIGVGGTGAVIRGNYVGVDATGATALANGSYGIDLFAFGPSATIGGTGTGEGNIVSGNGNAGILFEIGSTGSVKGNFIGTNAAGTASISGNGAGIYTAAAGVVIGGTEANAGNRISGSNTHGIIVAGAATTGVQIAGNSIWGNSGLGIDLGGDGVTVNNGLKTTGVPNLAMDSAVITSATSRGTQLTVSGRVGSAAGQSVFAGARVELFLSDGDASGYGEGQTYLGALTADASGGFSGTVTMPVSRLTMASRLSATATDALGNTSEFGPQFGSLVVDFVVNTNADAVDANIGDGDCLTAAGECSLRAAIAEVNAWPTLASTPTIAFAIPGCSTGLQSACRIAVGSALPNLTRTVVVDAQTQPGWSQNPVVGLDGSAAPSFASGLVVQAAGSTVRGLSIGGFGVSGVLISVNDVKVEGNHIGLALGGASALRNGSIDATNGGVWVTAGTGIVIGGSTAAQRNVLSGNGGAGVWVDGGTVTITGNYIGTNAAGTAAIGNHRWGVHLEGGSAHVVGGAATGLGNVIGGHTAADTGGLYIRANSVSVKGNVIGLGADRSTALPNGNAGGWYASGIDVRAGTGTVIGGTTAAEGNVIAGNNGHGIRVTGQAAQILGNSVYGNTWLGIDLGADGVSANDGVLNGSQPNGGMDHPVFTGAALSLTGTSITFTGYVGTGTGQAAFAGSRIEFFKVAADSSGYGEGQTYLGTLTADGNGRFSGTLAVTLGAVAVGDVLTATATGTAGHTSEFGPNTTVTSITALSPSGFNAFDTTTLLGSLTGTIGTRVAGVPKSIDVIALNLAGTGLNLSFLGTVSLNWLDARDDSGTISGSCRSSWVNLGSAGSVGFTGTGRSTLSITPPVTSTRVMRLQIRYTSPLGVTTTACTGDAFAVIPASLSFAATAGTSATAGTARTLNNASETGGVVHQAGRPFTLSAQALDATGAVMTGYTGTPTITVAGCVLPAGCTAGALSAATTAATGGVYTNNAVTYSEVGAVSLSLLDSTYADIDAADTLAAARRIASSLLTVGRFVPDSLTAAVSTTGQFATANAACMATGAASNFLGQGFGWASAPAVTLTARNAAGAVTTNWTGGLMKLAAGSGLVPTLAVGGQGSATLSSSFGAVSLSDLGGGQVRLSASTLDRFVLDVPSGTLQAGLTPNWTWSLTATDASEAAVPGNPTLVATASQAGLGFNQGGSFHQGRLALSATHGDARAGLRQLVQLQRYTSAGWVTMTEDRGCVTVAPQNLAVESPTGVFAAAGACVAPMTTSATTAGGRAWIRLPATPQAQHGRLMVRLAGEAATGNSCSATGALASLAPLGLPWLLGGTASAGPAALATWGKPNRNAVYRRETW